MLACWMVYHVASPWVGTFQEMRRLDRQGPAYYAATPRTSVLYFNLERAYFAARRREFDTALNLAAASAQMEPANPIFDYFAAAIYWEMEENDLALQAVHAGNAKRSLRVYAPQDVSPERWQWPQFDVIRYSAKRIIRDKRTDSDTLAALIVMGHRIVWCEPTDPNRLLLGVDIRQAAAERLEEIALNDGREDVARVCRDLIDEGQMLRRGLRRRVDFDNPIRQDARAWIITRALDSSDPKFRRVASLMRFERQAEWADQLRARWLRPKDLRALEQ